ncbi:hypothetical protein [Roseovarius sp. 217]|uniref:Cap15 family cyclic dinucleotide receptor domain-containing protein n=1 Tax=Roseovarius sp. (strain 217) TaxID=314264 RepID=UPI0000686FBF|nr:hypothetical protein [Roseovarius sp. 217]EAQ23584.1 hypothetical protein ROS217_07899 [Roseovarius sp. 217]
MYRVLDKIALIWVLFILFGVSLAVNAVLIRPETASEVMRVIYTTPATFGLISLVVGATPLWRKVWARIPQLNRWVFPDLNGRWGTEIHSNIAAMAAYHPDFANTDLQTIRTPVPGEFEIVQNWFRLFIRFDSDDRYSTSNTLVVEPRKDRDTGRFTLTYVFRNETPAPKPSDEQTHFGAAHVEIAPDFQSMRGWYWTNRNASRGLNTAGKIEAKRMQS